MILKKIHSPIIVLFCVFANFAQGLQTNDPRRTWLTLSSQHFDLIVDTEQKSLGQHYLKALEQARVGLSERFHNIPEKTTVVLNDNTDVTNGFAAPIPYPFVSLNPVLPSAQEGLGEYGQWAHEFVAHELTHVINFVEVGGVMEPLRSVFGTIVAPNILLPNWWKEGLAVEMETQLSRHGRSRSTYQGSFRRALTEEGKWERFTLASANEALIEFPYGNTPYFAGSLFWQYSLMGDVGDKAQRLNSRHGERAPYFVEEPAREIFGKSYLSQYGQALELAQAKNSEQIKTLKSQTPSMLSGISGLHGKSFGPQLSPDGLKLAFLDQSEFDRPELRIIERRDLKQSFVVGHFLNLSAPPEGKIQRISWMPNSKAVIYDMIDLASSYQEASDLYLYDIESGKSTRLTNGLRGREPAVASDGNKVLFIRLEGGKTFLSEYSLIHKTYKDLVSSDFDERISFPVVSEDGDVFYSKRYRKNLNGKAATVEEIFQFSRKDGLARAISSFESSLFPQIQSGKLYFVSNQSGVNNIYAQVIPNDGGSGLVGKKNDQIVPQTHVTTGLWTFAVDASAGEIIATRMTSDGPRLTVLPLGDRGPLPKISNEVPEDLTYREVAEQELAISSQEYSPTGYLWPRYWLPFLNASTQNGGTVYEVITSSADPLEMHSYTLDLAYDSGMQKGNYNVTYLNQATVLPWGVGGLLNNYQLGSSATELAEEEWSGFVKPDVFFIDKNLSLIAGVLNSRLKNGSRILTENTDVFGMLAYSNFNGGFRRLMPDGFAGYLRYQKKYSETRAGFLLLKDDHWFWRFDGTDQASEKTAINGEETQSYTSFYETTLPQHILRGYRQGVLYGNQLVTTNFEYRFLIGDLFRGSGTDPYYFRRLSGALVVDYGAANGFIYDEAIRALRASDMQRAFGALGFELKLSTTIGYLFPLNIVMGWYQQVEAPSRNDKTVALSLQIKGL